MSLPDPAALAEHYRRFRVAERLLLTGHSHQAWPDVAREAMLEAYDDAALAVDRKWDRAEAKADEVRAAVGRLLGEPGAAVALGSSTHELVVRMLSALDLRSRGRIVTTDGEFHTLRRQLARLGEEGIEVVRVPVAPVATLAERLAAETDERTALVAVSSVLFETSRIVPGLEVLGARCERVGAELLVDAYHHVGVVPFDRRGIETAWIVGGGYKYLQWGEGSCYLRLPSHAEMLRPVITGWYAEFDALAEGGDKHRVVYGPGPTRFAGSTYDPTSHYRAARVARFFDEQGLTPEVLRAVSQHQRAVLTEAFDALGLPDEVVSRDRSLPAEAFAGFLSLEAPDAGRLQQHLAERGVLTDSRGTNLRFGPAPYLTDDQLRESIAVLGEVAQTKTA